MTETGNEKIIERILACAKEAAAATLTEADRRAAERLDKEKAAIAAGAEAQAAARKVERERHLHAAQSAAELSVRNARLQRRRQEIDQTLEQTLAYLRALPDEKYFDLLRSLVLSHREGTGGELLLSAADRKRVPADFADSLGVTLSETPVAIDGGCILRYGDIEENLTFAALLDEKRDALEDRICRELWDA